MYNSAQHIIASLCWDTLFDRQDKAVDLQRRLSDWTANHLPATVQAVFDNVCPAGKVWSIRTLELNLGKIDYNDLEFELGQKIKTLLKEKLSGLVITKETTIKEAIQEDGESKSLTAMLAVYLRQGVMPWNHREEKGSVNQIVAALLKENTNELVTMVRCEGGHAVVRRRIAWQLYEAQVTGLIKGLEPVNHTQIIAFSHELNQVQQEESLVKANQQDFRKSVWEWVLGYLLTDQGSAFNSLTLMKSTIRQMAGHYNVVYEDLLLTIQHVVAKMGEGTRPSSGFLLMLKTLLAESSLFDGTGVPLSGFTTPGAFMQDELGIAPQKAGSLLELPIGRTSKLIADDDIVGAGQNGVSAVAYAPGEVSTALSLSSPMIDNDEVFFKDKSYNTCGGKTTNRQTPGINPSPTTGDTSDDATNAGHIPAQLTSLIPLENKTNGEKGDFGEGDQSDENMLSLQAANNVMSEEKSLKQWQQNDNAVKNEGGGMRKTGTAKQPGTWSATGIEGNTKGHGKSTPELPGYKQSDAKYGIDIRSVWETGYQNSQADKQNILISSAENKDLIGGRTSSASGSNDYLQTNPGTAEIEHEGDLNGAKTIDVSAIQSQNSNWTGNIETVFNKDIEGITAGPVAEGGLVQTRIRGISLPVQGYRRDNSLESRRVTIDDLIRQFLPGVGKVQQESIAFIISVTHASGLALSPAVLLNGIIVFARKYPGQPVPGAAFLAYCLDIVAAHNGIDRLQVLEKLAETFIPARVKTEAGINIHARLMTAWVESSGKVKPLASRLKEWVELLIGQLSAPLINKELFIRVLAQLKKYLMQLPAAGLAALTGFAEKEKLKILLPYLLDEKLTSLFWAQSQVREFRAIMHLPVDFKDLPDDVIKEIFLRTIITQTGLHNAGLQAGIERAILAEKHSVEEEKIDFFNVDKLLLPGNQAKVAILLALNFSNREFEGLRKEMPGDAAAILDYLLPGGKDLMAEVTQNYTKLLAPQLTGITENLLVKQLGEIFWKIIVNYNEHCGNVLTFKRYYRVAALLQFPQAFIHAAGILQRPVIYMNESYFKNPGSLTVPAILELLEAYLITGQQTAQSGGKKYHFRELLYKGLQVSPAQVRELIKMSSLPPNRLQMLFSVLPFDNLLLSFINDGSPIAELSEALRGLNFIVKKIAPGRSTAKLQQHFRCSVLSAIQTNENPDSVMKKMVVQTLNWLTEEKHVSNGLMVRQFFKYNQWVTPCLRQALAASHKAFVVVTGANPSKKLLLIAREGMLEDLIASLLHQNKVPVWYESSSNETAVALLEEVVVNYPAVFVRTLKRTVLPVKQVNWIRNSVSFSALLRGISKMFPQHQSKLAMLHKMYTALGRTSINGISSATLQQILKIRLIKTWETGKWRTINAATIWNELIWEAQVKHGASRHILLQGLLRQKQLFNPALQKSLTILAVSQQALAPKRTAIPYPAKVTSAATGIIVHNAGMVLLNGYYRLLLQRMDLVNGSEFKDSEAQLHAVHYLQFLATGLCYTEEPLLPLNKILCGLPLETPVTAGIDIPVSQAEIINGLIKAAIGHWSAIGSCSVEGFRGNWLVRDGILLEEADKWVLTVEKKPYDVLISRSPFSFSMIKLPWMPKHLQVNWAF